MKEYIYQVHGMPLARVMANSHRQIARKIFPGIKVKVSSPRRWDFLTESLDGQQRVYWILHES